MAIRKRKPTSPGRRFQTVSDFAEITRDRPERSLTKPKPRTGGRNSYGRHDVASPRRRAQAEVPRRRLPARQGRRAGEGRGHRVRPEPQRAHRAAPLPRRREALHPRSRDGGGRRHAPERARLRDPPGQRAAAALHPGRYDGAQRRAQARRGRQDRPRGRRGDPARRQGRPVRHAAPPVHRDAPGPDRLPRARSARSATPRRRW